MSRRVLVLGFGRVGRAVCRYLLDEGFEVTAADASGKRLRAAEEMGADALAVDVTSDQWADGVTKFDLVCSALPGRLGFRAVGEIVKRGVNVVDVSYFAEDPRPLDPLARERGCFVVVDAGLAPGLGSMLAGRAYAELSGLDSLEIYVGGFPKDPRGKPLGYAVTWSPSDLIEEYVRPARVVEGGEVIEVDPLSRTGKVEVPGVGEFEYFVSDGLRTMLFTLDGVEYMAEYTLRYPGHVDGVKLLRDLGLMSRERIRAGDVEVAPADVLAALFDRYLSKDERDVTVLYVKARKWPSGVEYLMVDEYDPATGLTSMARTTGFTQAAIAHAAAEGLFEEERGLIPPEKVGMWNRAFAFVLRKLEDRNVTVRRL